MKILFCGDRNWTDTNLIEQVFDMLVKEFGSFEVIQGEARGADTLCKQEAEKRGFVVHSFPADWVKYRKAAGPIRNGQMLKEGKPDLIIAFHPNLAESKGTRDMVYQSTKAGVPVRVFGIKEPLHSQPAFLSKEMFSVPADS